MRLELTSSAVSDLQSVRNYTLEKWGKDQEQKYLDALWKKFEALSSHPEHWRFRNDLFPGCQIASQGRHVILFRVNEGTLQIVRILHTAMDFKRHVPKEI